MTRRPVRKSSILLSFSVFVLLSVAVVATETRNDHLAGSSRPAQGRANDAPYVLRIFSRAARADDADVSLEAPAVDPELRVAAMSRH